MVNRVPMLLVRRLKDLTVPLGGLGLHMTLPIRTSTRMRYESGLLMLSEVRPERGCEVTLANGIGNEHLGFVRCPADETEETHPPSGGPVGAHTAPRHHPAGRLDADHLALEQFGPSRRCDLSPHAFLID